MTRAALIIAALAVALSPMAAQAQRLRVPGVGEVAVQPPPPQRPAAPPAARAEAPDLPMSAVIANVARSAPSGKLQDAKPATVDGRSAYIVQWAADGGRRIDFTVDAKTGRILSQK